MPQEYVIKRYLIPVPQFERVTRENDSGGFTSYNKEVGSKTLTVEILVEIESIARRLASRANNSKRKLSKYMDGAVQVKIVGES